MNNYHLNLFHPYRNDSHNEMSLTRAFTIACAKSPRGTEFLQAILSKAGLNSAFMDGSLRFGLEVSGSSYREADNCVKKYVLCIAPQTFDRSGIFIDLYKNPKQIENFRAVVQPNIEIPELKKLKNSLIDEFPELHDVLAIKSEIECNSILTDVWWDLCRLLHAGSRVDALITNSNEICLVESKIWGCVNEIQAKNHAQKFFGTTNSPVYEISWQVIFDITKKYSEDVIISDFADYLSEFSQLVRWDGYDLVDLQAFQMNGDKLPSDHAIQSRLHLRYYQSMEDLCSKFNYKVRARRANDWDFTPTEFNILGNLGIGYWACDQLSVKWCVGYNVWQMDQIMNRSNFLTKGEAACKNLITALKSSSISHGLSIQMRAVQRFVKINASDGVYFDGYPLLITNDKELEDDLRKLWQEETKLLIKYYELRGKELSSDDALSLKKSIYKMRYPNDMNAPLSMATKHASWELYPAFDLMVNINPRVFLIEETGEFMSKINQLTELDNIVRALAHFAEAISS